MMQDGDNMDWVKAIAVAGSAAYGVEKMLKVFRLWKQAGQAERGVTVKNGDYLSLLRTLGRIEKRIDGMHSSIEKRIEGLHTRVENIETRLSTS